MRRPATFASALRICAGLVLAGFVVGVPVALGAWGSPLPAHAPSWHGFVTDLQMGYVPSSVLGKVALGAGWAVWVFATYEILAETSSWIRHHAARRSSFLGPFQPLVSKLVAAAVLSAPVPGRGLLWVASPAPGSSAVALVGALADGGTSTVFETSTAGSAPTPVQPLAGAALPTYVVQPHDTLWGIADRHLGDALRWSEIAALNEGRAEGTSQFSDPHWIYPGWVLVLPADATGLPAPPAAPPVAPVPTDTPAPNPTTPSTPRNGASPSGSPAVPAPTTAARSPLSPSSPPSATPPPATATAPHSTPGRGDGRVLVSAPSTGQQGKGVPAPIVPIGAGLLGVGVGFALATARKAQQRHRRRGRRIPLPTGPLAEAETALAVGSDRDGAAWVNRTARLLAGRSVGAPSVPRVLAVVVRDEAVELVVDEGSADPPPPFVAAGAGRWRLPRSAEVEALDAETFGYPSALPGLVTVGRSGDGVVLLNLEAGGLVSVTGEGPGPRALAGAMAVELATCAWADVCSLYVIGLDDGAGAGLDTLERPRRFASLSQTFEDVARHVEENRAELERTGETDAARVRLREVDLDFSPLVVISAQPPTAEEEAVLSRRADASRLALAVVVAGELEGATWHLEFQGDGSLVVDPLGLCVNPQCLSRDEFRAVGELLLLAGRRDDVGPDEPPYDAIAEPHVPVSPEKEFDSPAREIDEEPEGTPCAEQHPCAPRMTFFGSVCLKGVPEAPPRPKSLELLSWLVLHPGGGDPDRVATVMWPDAFTSQGNVRTLVSRTRRWLGTRPGGAWYLPPHGALRLEQPLRSDWAELRALARSADPADWRRGLELVRGRPFADVDWTWATTEGFQASMEADVVDLADRAACCELAHGRLSEARWAAEQGLLASPYDERLYRVLMEVVARSSGTKAVRAVMSRLAAVLEADVEPADVVSEETRALFVRLTSPSPPGRGAGPTTNGHGPGPGSGEPGRSDR